MTTHQDISPGASPAITALRGPRGVALYRDARYGFSVAVPCEPKFMAPGRYVDASWELFDGRALFQVRVMTPPAGLSLADAVVKIARDVTKSEPVARTMGQIGVRAAVHARAVEATRTRLVDVFGGGPTGGGTWIAAVLFDHDPKTLRRFELDTVYGAIVGSAEFCDPVRYFVPPVFPTSAWFMDTPFALRFQLPPLQPAAPDPAVADAVLDVVDLLPPSHPLDDSQRGRIGQILATAGRLDPGGAVLSSLVTAHDVRGLARAIIIGL